MRLSVLGPTTFEGEDGVVEPGTPRQRAVLGYLGLHVGTAVSIDRLIELLWGDDPPQTATKTVQAYLSRLRKTTGLELPGDGSSYRLDLPERQVDAAIMADELAQARRAAAALAFDVADGHFAAALSLWRGMPLAELPDSALAAAEATHQLERYLAGCEDHHDARLALGHHGELVAELERFCQANPTRERSWAHLMLALYRAGRQAEALRAYQRARETLADELGIDPGPELVELERRILAQDPGLDRSTSDARPTATTPPEPHTATVPPPTITAMLTRGRVEPGRVVGRRRELDELHDWFWSGSGVRMRFLTGEPGIGKTTLAAAFCRELDGEAVALWGRCSPGLAMSYQPMIECAQDLLGRCDDEGARWAAGVDGAFLTYLLPELEPVLGVPPRVHRDVVEQRVVATAFDMIGRAGSVAPVMMVMDDLMWTANNTLAVLRHAMTSEALGALRLLVTQRTSTETDSAYARARAELIALGATDMQVTGLDRTTVAGLFESSSVEQVDQIMQATDGHPLFVSALRRAGRLGFDADEPIPAEIVETVRRWVDGLDELDRELIARFALLLAPLDDASIADVLGEEPDRVLDALDHAEALGLLRQQPDGSSRFEHEIVRRVLADLVTPRRRVRVHRDAFRTLSDRAEFRDAALRHGALAAPLVSDEELAAVRGSTSDYPRP